MNNQTISERIAGLRREKRMTQEELAGLIGVSAQTVSKWENSTTMPDILLLPLLADIFDITVDELFGRTAREDSGYPFEEAVDRCYDALLLAMRPAWQSRNENTESADEWLADVKRALEGPDKMKTQIRTHRNGEVWADQSLGLVLRMEPEQTRFRPRLRRCG